MAASGSTSRSRRQRLDGGLEAQLRSRPRRARPARAVSRVSSSRRSASARWRRSSSSRAAAARCGLALAAAALAQLAELASTIGEPVGDERGEAVDGAPAWRRARRGATSASRRASTAPLEPRLDLGQAACEELAALVEPGRRGPRGRRAGTPTAAARSSRWRLGVGHGPGPLGGVGLLGLEERQREPRARRRGPARGRAARRARRRARAARRPRWRRRGGRPRPAARPSVAAVSRPSCSSSWRASVAPRPGGPRRAASAAPCRLASACVGGGGGRVGPLAGLVERGAGGAGAEAVPTRQPVGAEAVAVAGDDDGVGVGEGGVDRRRPAAVDGDGARRAARRAARSTSASAARGRGARTGSPTGGGGAAPSVRRRARAPRRRRRRRRRLQRGDGRAGGVDAVDDDGGERLAGGRLERPPPSRRRSRPGRAACRRTPSTDGQALGAGAGAGLVEREAERLGPGRPRVAIGVGRAQRGLGLGDLLLGVGALLLGGRRAARRAAPRRPRPRRPRRAAGRPRRRAARASPRAWRAGPRRAPSSPVAALDARRAARPARRAPRRRRPVRRGRRRRPSRARSAARARRPARASARGELVALRARAPRPRRRPRPARRRAGRPRPRAWRSRPGRRRRRARARSRGGARRARAARPRAFSRSDSKRTRASPRSSPPVRPSSASAASTAVSSSARRAPQQRRPRSASSAAARRRRRRAGAASVASSRPARKSRSAGSSATRSPWRRAASAWRSSGRSWRRTSRSRSPRRVRLPSVAASRRSAFSLRLRYFRTPAASSMMRRRSSGRALSTASIWPWLTMTCCWRPTPVSESSSWMSSSRHGTPLMAYSLSPVRNSVRVIVTSVNSIGRRPGGVVDREADLGPAERRPLGGAGEDDVVHLLASAPREGAWAPSTQPMASTTLDLPSRSGPTTTVTPGSSSSAVVSAKDLKPFRVSVFRNIRRPSASGRAAERRGPRSDRRQTWQASRAVEGRSRAAATFSRTIVRPAAAARLALAVVHLAARPGSRPGLP